MPLASLDTHISNAVWLVLMLCIQVMPLASLDTRVYASNAVASLDIVIYSSNARFWSSRCRCICVNVSC